MQTLTGIINLLVIGSYLLADINVNPKDMSVLKVVEILGNSNKSWEDAVQQVVKEASKTIKNIKSVYVQDMQATVKNNMITEYRVNAKVTFGILDE